MCIILDLVYIYIEIVLKLIWKSKLIWWNFVKLFISIIIVDLLICILFGLFEYISILSFCLNFSELVMSVFFFFWILDELNLC